MVLDITLVKLQDTYLYMYIYMSHDKPWKKKVAMFTIWVQRYNNMCYNNPSNFRVYFARTNYIKLIIPNYDLIKFLYVFGMYIFIYNSIFYIHIAFVLVSEELNRKQSVTEFINFDTTLLINSSRLNNKSQLVYLSFFPRFHPDQADIVLCFCHVYTYVLSSCSFVWYSSHVSMMSTFQMFVLIDTQRPQWLC